MKSRRKITDPICFYTTHEMRSGIEQMAEEMGYTISELMREIVTFYQTKNTPMVRTAMEDGRDGGER